jgi:hypothetical protein
MPDAYEIRSGIPRTQLFYADPTPKRVGEPVPTGWRELQTAVPNMNYELTSSNDRMMLANEMVQWSASAQSVRGYLNSVENRDVISTLPDLWEEEERWRQHATAAEAVRLHKLLSSAPTPARGQHVNQRVLPAVHTHFTTLRQGNKLRIHKNLRLPLDQPHDLEPMVPRAWKLAQSRSSPALSRMAQRRRANSPQRSPSLDRPPLQQDGAEDPEAAAERVMAANAQAILAKISRPTTPKAQLPSAPNGMSGLPSSVPLRKVWSYSDASRKPLPMAYMDAKGKIRRVGPNS